MTHSDLHFTSPPGKEERREVAVALEKVALSDEYFVKRKLCPNVDSNLRSDIGPYHTAHIMASQSKQLMSPEKLEAVEKKTISKLNIFNPAVYEQEEAAKGCWGLCTFEVPT